jgi:hypothetical protein
MAAMSRHQRRQFMVAIFMLFIVLVDHGVAAHRTLVHTQASRSMFRLQHSLSTVMSLSEEDLAFSFTEHATTLHDHLVEAFAHTYTQTFKPIVEKHGPNFHELPMETLLEMSALSKKDSEQLKESLTEMDEALVGSMDIVAPTLSDEPPKQDNEPEQTRETPEDIVKRIVKEHAPNAQLTPGNGGSTKITVTNDKKHSLWVKQINGEWQWSPKNDEECFTWTHDEKPNCWLWGGSWLPQGWDKIQPVYKRIIRELEKDEKAELKVPEKYLPTAKEVISAIGFGMLNGIIFGAGDLFRDAFREPDCGEKMTETVNNATKALKKAIDSTVKCSKQTFRIQRNAENEKACEKQRDNWADMFEQAKAAFAGCASLKRLLVVIVAILGVALVALPLAGAALGSVFPGIGTAIGAIVGKVLKIGMIILAAVTGVSFLVKSIRKFLQARKRCKEGPCLKADMIAMIEAATETVGIIVGIVCLSGLDKVIQLPKFKALFTGAKPTFQPEFLVQLTKLNGAVKSAKSGNLVKSMVPKAKAGVGKFMQTATDDIAHATAKAKAAAKAVWNWKDSARAIGKWASTKASNAVSAVKSGLRSAGSAIKGGYSKAKSAVSGFFGKVGGFFSRSKTAVTTVARKAKSSGSSWFSNLRSKVSSIFGGSDDAARAAKAKAAAAEKAAKASAAEKASKAAAADDAAKAAAADDAAKAAAADDAAKASAIDDAAKASDDAAKSADDAANTVDDAAKAADDAAEEGARAAAGAKAASGMVDDAARSVDDVAKSTDDVARSADDAAKSSDDAARQSGKRKEIVSGPGFCAGLEDAWNSRVSKMKRKEGEAGEVRAMRFPKLYRCLTSKIKLKGGEDFSKIHPCSRLAFDAFEMDDLLEKYKPPIRTGKDKNKPTKKHKPVKLGIALLSEGVGSSQAKAFSQKSRAVSLASSPFGYVAHGMFDRTGKTKSVTRMTIKDGEMWSKKRTMAMAGKRLTKRERTPVGCSMVKNPDNLKLFKAVKKTALSTNMNTKRRRFRAQTKQMDLMSEPVTLMEKKTPWLGCQEPFGFHPKTVESNWRSLNTALAVYANQYAQEASDRLTVYVLTKKFDPLSSVMKRLVPSLTKGATDNGRFEAAKYITVDFRLPSKKDGKAFTCESLMKAVRRKAATGGYMPSGGIGMKLSAVKSTGDNIAQVYKCHEGCSETDYFSGCRLKKHFVCTIDRKCAAIKSDATILKIGAPMPGSPKSNPKKNR